ncbi:helix-turn-helix transcriptional regulator [Streptomyces sp. P01-B04]|uniref:Helix-turn-helix transcriptional regulator n=1 Tax=Streptomyces poriferorum TaxID=2798799 RepID=A0ABY9ISU1_9ACTN|nr:MULTISPECIES: helix-turn-helix transcriptional regulator [Streptomyces]MBW5251404.1 helix-turn-helix transcriptional regulator [Streptomyces poriferorum]MBW5258806.1 helix-turn-helix transcriptional regulator [Streptomyces poriferorum]MDP5312510.1 helix-turn-helix transcriptional regulator [Streptomyces sp. Alt4]WLQ58458.1 helix-turn-helix transcriptional regulator [Streptomyces sp. Alt2]
MATRKEIDGSAGVPQFYGKELRFKREEAGLTLEKLADGSFFGITYLSEIEHGHRRMPRELAQHVDRVLGTDGFFQRRCEDVRKARQGAHAAYFAEITEAEARARSIGEWSGTLIPGLLQTRAYAHALIDSAHSLDTPEEVEAKIDGRLGRARLFNDPKRPEYWVILHESLVDHSIVPPVEMAEQLDHIAALVQRRRIVAQILPWNGPTLALTELPLFLMDFDDEPPLLYTEGPYHGQTIDDPALVMRYRKAYDRLRAAALPPEASLTLIEGAAEEYRHGQHRP